MQMTYVRNGNTVNITAYEAIAAGQLVAIGADFYGVAERAIPAGEVGAVTVKGVFTATAKGEIALGAPVYADATGAVTATAATGQKVGVAVTAAADGAVVEVMLA